MGNNTNPIKVVLAEEDPAILQDLHRALECESGVCLLGETAEADCAVRLVRHNSPDILLIDFGLAQQCQLKGLNESKRFPPVHVIVTIAATEKTQLIEALRLGAHGVLLKRSKQEMLLNSFRGVMAGQYWLERDTVGVLVEVLRDSLAQANGTKSPKDYGLTRREIDIITKIASGRSNKEVGEEFAISERTVKHHLTNIFGKVGVTSRLQLALFAVNQNFMGHPGPPLLLPTMQQDDEL